jgi:hypothetical protein
LVPFPIHHDKRQTPSRRAKYFILQFDKQYGKVVKVIDPQELAPAKKS